MFFFCFHFVILVSIIFVNYILLILLWLSFIFILTLLPKYKFNYNYCLYLSSLFFSLSNSRFIFPYLRLPFSSISTSFIYFQTIMLFSKCIFIKSVFIFIAFLPPLSNKENIVNKSYCKSHDLQPSFVLFFTYS